MINNCFNFGIQIWLEFNMNPFSSNPIPSWLNFFLFYIFIISLEQTRFRRERIHIGFWLDLIPGNNIIIYYSNITQNFHFHFLFSSTSLNLVYLNSVSGISFSELYHKEILLVKIYLNSDLFLIFSFIKFYL